MGREIPTIEIPKTDVWGALFERTDREFPDDQVIYLNPLTSRQYTYASLLSTTQSLGTYFLSSSSFRLQKGDVLALFAQNCIDTPAVTWAAHYAGGIVSPANPAYTVRELVHHLRGSGSKFLFTQEHLLPVALEAARECGVSKGNVVCMGEGKEKPDPKSGVRWLQDLLGEAKKIVEENGIKERVKVDVEKDLAFLVYSSGTTGLPKGVMLSHSNVVSNLFMLNTSEGEILHWKKDKVLSVLPYYHIYGLQTLIHLPAYAGFTTVVMSSFDLKLFCSIIQNHKITYTYIAPPIVLHLAKNPIVNDYDLSSLRMMTSGAAPLTRELIYAVKERLGTEVKQAYGLSETSPATHIQKDYSNGLGSCGPALPNQVIKFMDPDGKEVEAGKEGEVWVKGPNVFKGYHNNEKATRGCMTDDGFFMTGDIGYEDERGNMFITDRVKELIKYKGYQVAPAELEGLLNSHPQVVDVAVIGIHDASRESEVPLACIVVKDGTPSTQAKQQEMEKEIVDWLASKVANHKQLRGGVWFVDEVPKSASGKILRRVLKDRAKDEGRDGRGKKEKARL
ncbi:related to 4-coumarate-CoA ligase [Rhynchosporium secalis]|uniref:Related to 4-coumarate-CoA ligase n=1 Tax=Rhynchosporium secalis TaxID=38038 RepID=A0A1E1MSN5_RHYSE|nr:related to 4-coumarate-CoA ligase [Rhynchosporium secalis]